MERMKALEDAAKFYNEQISITPTNTRGYPQDGWKAPSVTDRWYIIKDIADYLMLGETPPVTVSGDDDDG